MKTVIIVVLIIVSLSAAGLVALLWDYIYYPLMESKVEVRASAYFKSIIP